jgi:hypothetical protein
LYQGTALAGPLRSNKELGFSPNTVHLTILMAC